MELKNSEVVTWLLQGDIAIQYQTHRDILCSSSELINELQSRISSEGWGKCFLAERVEQTGGDSRWNTLRVLRVLKFYMSELFGELINKEETQ
jgi:hypothetical protein